MSKPSDYEVGQKVFCHAYGHWYEGEVKKIGRTKVHIEYTSGTGTTRVKPCSMDQISLEKLEGERAGIGERRAARSHRHSGPVMVQTQIDLSGMNGPRLMAAFQVLAWPSGFYRGTTHRRAREVIFEVAGIKLKRNAKPPRGEGLSLEGYLEWAANPDLQNPVDGLDPGVHIVQVVKAGEEKDLPPGTPFVIEREPEERGMEIG